MATTAALWSEGATGKPRNASGRSLVDSMRSAHSWSTLGPCSSCKRSTKADATAGTKSTPMVNIVSWRLAHWFC